MAHYQKPYSLGKTNVEQRWKDVVDCGGTFGDKHIKDIWQRQVFSDKGGNPNDRYIYDKFEICMKKKGYIYLNECGRKNSKTDKGVCNE
ncbi:hypothetical protein [Pasteurella bettyae]|uniref:Uncharacterized protein n=1 Tax=Pasteurella bettyae CCUG 2042 TaxID=1095749 RepID=I3D746_9PAST|nr:hypothetical protein [Pasteurella bettyae]EIJ67539.1 hypothetical protein HMPREF1052_2217 [Pasteurella bettyae CCUG 2042]SUB21012.1 Uncharacterised protein [Pasteurella bettyae]